MGSFFVSPNELWGLMRVIQKMRERGKNNA
jgi:hypothetical protein